MDFWTAFVDQDEWALKQVIQMPLQFLGFLLYKTAITTDNFNSQGKI